MLLTLNDVDPAVGVVRRKLGVLRPETGTRQGLFRVDATLREAVSTWQAAHALPATGDIDDATYTALLLA